MRPYFCLGHVGGLLAQHLLGQIHFNVELCQTLVQRRAFQRTVIDVDDDRRAVVEEWCRPLCLLCFDAHQGILIGCAGESKLTVGNNHAVDSFFCQLVYQVDLLAVFCICSANGILHLCH